MKNLSQTRVFRFSAVLMVCVLLVYTSCKKTQVITTSTTTSTSANTDVAKQIALNFYKALTGGYNGMNINNGIQANMTTNNNNHVLNSINPLCGLTIDTSYNNVTKQGDTTFMSFGTYKFTYTCSKGTVDGYKLADTANSNVGDSTFRSINNASQNYVVVATDNTYKKLLTNGLIVTTSEYSALSNGAVTGYTNIYARYLMTAVKVDISSGIADAVSGTAAFHMQFINKPVTGKTTNILYVGLITYLGNHMAKVDVLQNGKYISFMVNMITGATTPL
jgi:hypothetical protein